MAAEARELKQSQRKSFLHYNYNPYGRFSVLCSFYVLIPTCLIPASGTLCALQRSLRRLILLFLKATSKHLHMHFTEVPQPTLLTIKWSLMLQR